MKPSPSEFQPLALPAGAGICWLTEPEGREWLCLRALPAWLPTRRWFSEKARTLSRCAIEHAIPAGGSAGIVFIVRIEFADGPAQRYAVPLSFGPESTADSPALSVLARDASGLTLRDAVFDLAFRQALLEFIGAGGSALPHESAATLRGIHGAGLDGFWEDALDRSVVLGLEQSNTSILYGRHLFMKLFRRFEPGPNPDIEVSRYLSEVRGFRHVPPFAGAIECVPPDGPPAPFALLLGWVENRGDAWAWALEEVRAARTEGALRPVTALRLEQLGQRTAEMHLALCEFEAREDFRPEPLTSADFAQLADDVSRRLDATLATLAPLQGSDPLVQRLAARIPFLHERIRALGALPPGSFKMRHHGDYHLGQVLDTGSDWTIIDFEGEPLRTLAERRAKRSPLRDVAGMVRSLHYAAHAPDPAADPAFSARWHRAAADAWLAGYRARAAGAPFLPAQEPAFDLLLSGFLLEKALYEIDYELNNRPAWLRIPLAGLLAILDG